MNDQEENKDLAEEIVVTELPEDPDASQADDKGEKKKGKGKKRKKKK